MARKVGKVTQAAGRKKGRLTFFFATDLGEAAIYTEEVVP